MTSNNLLPTTLMHYQEKVMRISKIITLKRNTLIPYQILSTNSLTKCMEISLENLYSKIILSFKGPRKSLPSTYMIKISSKQVKQFFYLDRNDSNKQKKKLGNHKFDEYNRIDRSVIKHLVLFDWPNVIVSSIMFDYRTQSFVWLDMPEIKGQVTGKKCSLYRGFIKSKFFFI